VTADILAEQIAYYRARAATEDEALWLERRDVYDLGPDKNRAWLDEWNLVCDRFDELPVAGNVLEVACGTGWIAERLAARAERVLGVDAAPEALAQARERTAGRANVRFVEADVFTWVPDERFDFIVFAFWLSHVPEERFAAFWTTVRSALASGGRVWFVDNASNSYPDMEPAPPVDGIATRHLADGRTFRIVKHYYEPDALEARLAALGWRARIETTGRYFLIGDLTQA
jgi:demethylmenaquinone methyltransferase/2-methoxy-6-polyprenyl-1,4-benzoquinol methylase